MVTGKQGDRIVVPLTILIQGEGGEKNDAKLVRMYKNREQRT
jgi:hypothetical protein